ncbi:hypothetical protein QBA54_05315 [Streptomyces sp. B21-108]|uniref:hypothetical protein n=1 Tax=Streptomyces sp. B21-108 TaxID=3039419 RepID=UPI002FF00FD8
MYTSGLTAARPSLNQWGLPMTVSGWKQVFADANDRCRARGVGVAATPHMLRHSYAVTTLELLWRDIRRHWAR